MRGERKTIEQTVFVNNKCYCVLSGSEQNWDGNIKVWLGRLGVRRREGARRRGGRAARCRYVVRARRLRCAVPRRGRASLSSCAKVVTCVTWTHFLCTRTPLPSCHSVQLIHLCRELYQYLECCDYILGGVFTIIPYNLVKLRESVWRQRTGRGDHMLDADAVMECGVLLWWRAMVQCGGLPF